MNAAMVHRGPDDDGAYVDGEAGAALGARRLSVIDVAGGHQPLSNEDGTVWAVLNGEIYNHPALQQRLRERGHTLRTATDTEVLVHLYEDFGDDLVHALDGMFAFAVWDTAQRRLLVARDRFGEKPLFYAERDGAVTFASELTALRLGLGGPAELDPAAVEAAVVLGYVPGTCTMLKDVHQLPPGHRMAWQDGHVAVQRYWSLPETTSGMAEGFDATVHEAEALLDRSVRSRMVADVPLGVFLSGGVDSTIITAMAARHTSRLKTFTVGYDVGQVNETSAARHTAQIFGTDHRELVLTEQDIASRVPALMARLDQPLADPALVALNAVSELARRDVTVAVGGEGADELFGGYPRYRWLRRADRVPDNLPASLGRVTGTVATKLTRDTRARRLADVLAPGTIVHRHVDWVTDGRRTMRPGLTGPLVTGGRDALVDTVARIAGPATGDVAADLMHLDQRLYLVDDVLAKADRASMFASLEMRTPFLQRELAEFAATIPSDVHLRDGGKSVLRAILGRVLPEQDAPRPKIAFRVPVADWLRGPLAGFLTDQAAGSRASAEGWLPHDTYERMAREHVGGHADWSHALWPMLAFSAWLESFPL